MTNVFDVKHRSVSVTGDGFGNNAIIWANKSIHYELRLRLKDRGGVDSRDTEPISAALYKGMRLWIDAEFKKD